MTVLDETTRAGLDRLIAPDGAAPAWDDVLARAGVPRRRRARLRLLAAAAVAAVLAVTPALAFHGTIRDLFSGPSRARVERDYASLPLDGRVGGVHGRVDRARRVATWRRGNGERLTLAVGVVESGGFCWRFHGRRFGLGGCATERKRATFTRPGLSTAYPASPTGPLTLAGVVTYAGARSLEVVYARGSRQRIPLVWVSQPVDAGFFYFETRAGWKATAVQLRDRANTVVSRLSLARDPRLARPKR